MTVVKNQNTDQTAEQVKEPSVLESSGEVVVEHHNIPPKAPIDKEIHPRHPLPLIPSVPTSDD
jgi:hypothetical protein